MPDQPSDNIRLLRLKQVLELIPVSASTIRNRVKAGRFAQPVQLNPGVPNGPIAFIESEVLACRDEMLQHRGFGPQMECLEGLAHRAALHRRNPPKYGFKRLAPIPAKRQK